MFGSIVSMASMSGVSRSEWRSCVICIAIRCSAGGWKKRNSGGGAVTGVMLTAKLERCPLISGERWSCFGQQRQRESRIPIFAKNAKVGHPPFDPVLTSCFETVGAPSFAHVAKGGYRITNRNGFGSQTSNEPLELILSATSYPPLHKTQGRGTHSSRTGKKSGPSKDGPPAWPGQCSSAVGRVRSRFETSRKSKAFR